MIVSDRFDDRQIEQFRRCQAISYSVLDLGGPAISDHRPAPGSWTVEPHLGRGTIGVKWEELLLIEGDDVYWLGPMP